MKSIHILKTWSILSIFCLFIGCDLPVQERFVFEPEVDIVDPFAEITAWEFINSGRALELDDEGELIGDNFNYLKAAIEAADMVDEYNSANNERTYLLLNNNAFLGNGDVIDLITGSEEIEEGETPEEIMARADLDVLRLILKYHIVTTYITQTNVLLETDVSVKFQTLIPGEDGVIYMRRNALWSIQINQNPVPLPNSAFGGGNNETVRNHNYVFNNGIGHSLNDPVRNRPYPAPNN
ncbi:hypothetical protein [Zobellia sp. 1_MG-2023]|uniref:hypothetical protein n=1 Tax=Zobellia sp. 1_MG-2023 TaxID=3062626 RepID=UPI0026E214C2|nr:hypothetical protein [Zobellia sp. 1_MG-2023]MDO6820395.1 hypothetical protein [Zobellia sp. 1_MG-2023]